MKQTVTEHDFIDGFRICNREDNFSYEGRQALFEYFEQLEDDEDIEDYTRVIPVWGWDRTGGIMNWKEIQIGIIVEDW